MVNKPSVRVFPTLWRKCCPGSKSSRKFPVFLRILFNASLTLFSRSDGLRRPQIAQALRAVSCWQKASINGSGPAAMKVLISGSAWLYARKEPSKAQ